MKLYTLSTCPQCHLAADIADKNNVPVYDVDTHWDAFVADCKKLGYSITECREAPVLVTEDLLFTGQDVIIELEERFG